MSEELPKGWKRVKVSSVGELFRGINYKKDVAFNIPSTGYLPILRAQNINGQLNFEDLVYVPEDLVKDDQIIRKGDIIFAMSSGSKHLVGKSAVAKVDFNGSYGAFCAMLRIKEEVNKQYMAYVFKSNSYRSLISGIAKGTNINNLKREHILDFEFPLPPKSTQLAIVSKIEELFSEIEKGIESLSTAKQQLKKYRQSVLKWAFEGKLTNGLNHDLHDLPDEHDLSIAAEPETEYKVEGNHGNQANQKNHGSDKGELPEGWKWVKIEDVAIINPKLPQKDEIDNNLEVQFLPMKLVEEIINKIHLVETRLFKEVQKGSYTPFIDGDIIFAKVTPCMENGKIAVVENLKNGIGYGSSEFHVLRCAKDALNKYLFYFLVQDRFRNEAQNAMTGAVGLRRVPKQFIENHLIPLPPFAEQNQVVQAIESRLSVADKMEESITESLQQAEALKQSILKKAFEGKLLN